MDNIYLKSFPIFAFDQHLLIQYISDNDKTQPYYV